MNIVSRMTSDWKAQFREVGVEVLRGVNISELVYGSGCLLVGNCSRTKGRSGDAAIPKRFYKGENAQRVITFAEYHGLPYGILSDLYGIHFHDEALPYYDIHPSEVLDKAALADTLRKKCEERGIWRLVYSNTSPCRARFYLDLILMAGLQVGYVTRLKRIRKGFGLCSE